MFFVSVHLPYQERFFDLPMTNSSLRSFPCRLLIVIQIIRQNTPPKSSFRSFDKTHLQNCHSDHSIKHISKIVIQIIRQNTTPPNSSVRSVILKCFHPWFVVTSLEAIFLHERRKCHSRSVNPPPSFAE